MISQIIKIENIGKFRYLDTRYCENKLGKLTLIYSENGMGKSTLADIFRSLVRNDPNIIIGRKRLGTSGKPLVVIQSELGEQSNKVVYKDGCWNQIQSHIRIFDEIFIDENVCSGLDVSAQHRQNLHNLVLGEDGVELDRRLRVLDKRNEEINSLLREKENEIKQKLNVTFPPDLVILDFCNLDCDPDIDAKIENVTREINVAKNQEEVRNKPLFELIDLPSFDIDSITQLLTKGLQGINVSIETRIREHFDNLGHGAEHWVATGTDYLSQLGGHKCPYCGQSVTNIELIHLYRDFFSEEYKRLKLEVANEIANINSTHSEGATTKFVGEVWVSGELIQFWKSYCNTPQTIPETQNIVDAWTSAFTEIKKILSAKQRAPLEQTELGDEVLRAINKYEALRETINLFNSELSMSNDLIKSIKENPHTVDLNLLSRKKTHLLARKERFTQEIQPLCEKYLEYHDAKETNKNEIDLVRKRIKVNRERSFPIYMNKINSYFDQFNTGFTLAEFTYADRKGGPTSTYKLRINNQNLKVDSETLYIDQPSVRNSLSSGDRNTLAFAIFFTSLDQDPKISEKVVIIDDPMSSLDEHRSSATIDAISYLMRKAGQVILLSHNKNYLYKVWESDNQAKCYTLETEQSGEGTMFCEWDIRQDMKDEHYKRDLLLRNCTSNQSVCTKAVVKEIRLHLEAYLKHSCPTHFPPEITLGRFISKCKEKIGSDEEILSKTRLDELDSINKFARDYHHENDVLGNKTQIQSFVKRTLKFINP